MTDRKVEFRAPVRQGKGSYWVADFYVFPLDGEATVVEVKLTWAAEEVFAREMKVAQPHLDPTLREEIVSRWGEEKIRDRLNAGYEPPREISMVTRPGGPNSVIITEVEAQLMLKKWGLI